MLFLLFKGTGSSFFFSFFALAEQLAAEGGVLKRGEPAPRKGVNDNLSNNAPGPWRRKADRVSGPSSLPLVHSAFSV